MKTALVAGGAGFLGSHLCRRLLKRYQDEAAKIPNLIIGGRLGGYIQYGSGAGRGVGAAN